MRSVDPFMLTLYAIVVAGLIVGVLLGYMAGSTLKAIDTDIEKQRLREIIDTIIRYPEIWNITEFGCKHWGEAKALEIAEKHNVTDPEEIERIYRAIWFVGWLKGKIADSPLTER